MAEVTVGEVWKDCDPRIGDRTITVLKLDQRFAYVISSRGKESRIDLTHFHNKPGRRRGFVRVPKES